MDVALSDTEKDLRAALLRRVPLFTDLRQEDLARLAEVCEVVAYQPGQELYHQSDTDGRLFVIQSGQVALYHLDPHGEEAVVGARTGPDPASEAPFTGWLGEASILLVDPHDVTAVATDLTTTLELTHDQLIDKELGVWSRLKPQSHANAERVKYVERRYKWQDKDEVVLKYVSQHSWALLQQMARPVALLLIMLAAFVLISNALGGLSGLLIVLTLIVPIALGVVVFIDWRDDYYVVTNKRVIHLDEVPWGRQKREEAPLGTIQEIQVSRLSLPAQLFDFGDLRVETFGGSVAMQYVPRPGELRALIFSEKGRVLARGRAAARKSIYKDLVTRVGKIEKTVLKPASPPPPKDESFSVARALRRALRYFFPPAREVEGNRITYRTHWVMLFRKSRFPFVFLGITIFGMFNWWAQAFPFGVLPDSFWVAWPILLLVFGGWSWWIFEDWRNDLYIVTADRIIDIQRTPLLLRETRKEATLDKVQTLETNIPSALARFLRYGNVIVRVPGSAFEFKNVRDPAAIQIEISRHVDEFKKAQAQTAERGRRTELSDWFAVYEQIKSGYTAPSGGSAEASERKPNGNA